MGGAGVGPRDPPAGHHADPRPPVGGHAGQRAAPGARRVGTRLLPAVPDRQEALLRRDLEPVELERRGAALRLRARSRLAARAGGGTARAGARGAALADAVFSSERSTTG